MITNLLEIKQALRDAGLPCNGFNMPQCIPTFDRAVTDEEKAQAILIVKATKKEGELVDPRKDAKERIKAKWDQLSQEQKDLALLSGMVEP